MKNDKAKTMRPAERAARITALVSNDDKRSKTALLREVFPEVEAAMQAGVPRAAIIEELAATGLVFSLRTFDSTMTRLRNRLRTEVATKSSLVRRSLCSYLTAAELAEVEQRAARCVPVVVDGVTFLEEPGEVNQEQMP